MDLRLYGRVLRRFRRIVVPGLLLAVVLAALSFVRVGPGGVAYRQSETWQSTATLFLTQPGFPWGRLHVGDGSATSSDSTLPSSEFGDPSRLAKLTILYAQLATSDEVRQALLRDGPVGGSVAATPDLASTNPSDALPMINVVAISDTRASAMRLARGESDALSRVVAESQASREVARASRVELKLVKRPISATRIKKRSLVIPVVVFLTLALIVVAIAFVLENVRPGTYPELDLEVEAAASLSLQ